PSMVNGPGTVRTQGTVGLSNTGTFGAPLNVNTGTTTASGGGAGGVFNGAMTIDPGATLKVDVGSLVLTNGDVTNAGTLSGGDGLSIFRFKGSTFSNSGSVTTGTVDFNRTGAQTLSGGGSFSGNTAFVSVGSTTTLSSTHQLSALTINGTFDISSQTLKLSGAGTPLTVAGTFTRTGSTVEYDGTS